MSESPSVIDLKTPPSGHPFKATVEPDETVADRYVCLFKDLVLFLVAVSFVLLIVGM